MPSTILFIGFVGARVAAAEATVADAETVARSLQTAERELSHLFEA